jgi:hypothetical protein
MSLKISHIRLRVQTNAGLYGTDVALGSGLTILYAPNTSGKSTLLHAFLYALGLEQMLSPKREIPLSYAMRDYVEDPTTGVRADVIESYVAVEIVNARGEYMTVRRGVISQSNRKLVSVVEGPELSKGPGDYARRDYFVLDPGAAQREAGFHRKLAQFMGWDLPTVKRYDGSDCVLYVETIFPLFFVEQKVGWTTIPGAIPTQFRIREVHKRAVEFLMALETHENELRRQDLELRAAAARTEWTKTVEAIGALASASGLRPAALPTIPSAIEADVRNAYLEVSEGRNWQRLASRIAGLAAELSVLEEQQIPKVETVAEGAAAEADKLASEIQMVNAERATIFRARQTEIVQQASTGQRIEQLEEDLKKNKDALKLQKFGSTIGRELDPNHCPTCEQPIDDALLPQGTLEAVMSLEDNIQYIDAQRKAFDRLADRSVAVIRDLDLELVTTGEDLRRLTSRLRALRSDLIAPSHAASASFIEERLRIEQRLIQLRDIDARFAEHINGLVEQVANWVRLQGEIRLLPNERLSADDVVKIDALEASVRRQLGRYGFITFPAADLTVSKDTYRPEKEGFEIGFELSASDSIRLKWAYQLGLLDLAKIGDTNHPGLVVFDEPRQQEAAPASVAGLIAEAGRIAASGKQILIATSEDLDSVRKFVDGVDHKLVVFDGRIIDRIATRA